MYMEQRDIDTIIRLSKEGKQISRIREEDYPELDYDEIYEIIYEAGERSAQGVKRIISNRINELNDMIAHKDSYQVDELQNIVSEINGWVNFLYERHRANQKKLDSIREVINN